MLFSTVGDPGEKQSAPSGNGLTLKSCVRTKAIVSRLICICLHCTKWGGLQQQAIWGSQMFQDFVFVVWFLGFF